MGRSSRDRKNKRQYVLRILTLTCSLPPPPHALLPSLIVTILNRARIGGRSCECKRISQRNKPFPTSSFMNPLNVPLSVKVNLRNYCRIIYFKIRSKNHYLFHTLFTNNHYIFSLSATQ